MDCSIKDTVRVKEESVENGEHLNNILKQAQQNSVELMKSGLKSEPPDAGEPLEPELLLLSENKEASAVSSSAGETEAGAISAVGKSKKKGNPNKGKVIKNVTSRGYYKDDEGFCHCPYCTYKSRHSGNVWQHVTHNHTKERTAKCPECDYWTYPTCIKAHVRNVHTPGKPFSCPQCDYSSKTKGNVRKHFRVMHTEDGRNHKCEYCDYATSETSRLRVHTRSQHTNHKPFTCPYCEYRSVSKEPLRVHVMRKHPTSDPIPCRYCKSFSSHVKKDINKHVKRVHPKQWAKEMEKEKKESLMSQPSDLQKIVVTDVIPGSTVSSTDPTSKALEEAKDNESRETPIPFNEAMDIDSTHIGQINKSKDVSEEMSADAPSVNTSGKTNKRPAAKKTKKPPKKNTIKKNEATVKIITPKVKIENLKEELEFF